MVVNEFRKTLACVAWLFFREHYSFVGSTTERLAAKTLACLGYAGYKNVRERGAISSRFLCPSLPADVLWGSFVTHSFLLCGELSGEATSALVPPGPARLYLLFPLNQNRQTKQARKNLCCLKKVQRHHITALGQVTLFSPGFSVFRRTLPTVDFSLRGGGVGGRNYTG